MNPAAKMARVHATLAKKSAKTAATRKLVDARLEKTANAQMANVHASRHLQHARIFHCSLHLMGPWYGLSPANKFLTTS